MSEIQTPIMPEQPETEDEGFGNLAPTDGEQPDLRVLSVEQPPQEVELEEYEQPRSAVDMMRGIAARARDAFIEKVSTRGAVRAVSVVAMASLSLSACSVLGDGESKNEGKTSTPSVSARDDAFEAAQSFDAKVQERVEANTKLADVMQNAYSYGSLQEYLHSKPKDVQERLADIAVATDYAEAEVIATDLNGYPDQEKIKQQLAEIQDPKLRNQVVSYQKKVETLNSIDDAIGEVDPEPTTKDMTKAQTAIEKVSDESLQEIAMKSLQAHYVKAIASELSYEGISYKQAMNRLELVSDPELLQKAKQLMKSTDRASKSYGYEDSSRQYDDERAVDDIIDKADEKLQSQRDKADNIREGFDEKITEIYHDSDEKIDEMLTDYAERVPFEPISEKTVTLGSRKSEAIDFTNLHGGQQINNDSSLFESNGGGENPPTYQQFASVTVEGGRMVFRTVHDTGLTEQGEESMEQVVDDISPLIVEAFKRGDLNGIHYVMAEKYSEPNGSHGPSRDVYVEVPAGKAMSSEFLKLITVHETIGHALSSEVFNKSAYGDREARLMGKVCTDLKTAAYNSVEAHLALSTDKIADVEAQVGVKYHPAFEKLRQLIDDRDIAELGTQAGEDTHANDCLQYGLNGLLSSILSEEGIEMPEDTTIDDLFGDIPEYNELQLTWQDAIKEYAVYSYLHESTYYGEKNNEYVNAGHAYADAEEVVASSVTSALLYPDLMAKSLAELPKDERRAAVAAVTLGFKFVGMNGSEASKRYFAKQSGHLKQLVKQYS